MINPYAKDLGDLDAIAVMAETPRRIEDLAGRLDPDGWARSLAPGKWSAHQIVSHLVQVELVFGVRARHALALPAYVVQPFDQDDWVAREPLGDPSAAVAAFCALRRWNLALFRSLTGAERAIRFDHPERGPQTVQLLLDLHGGHDRRHIAQLEAIAAAKG
jgi:hypothetical protein